MDGQNMTNLIRNARRGDISAFGKLYSLLSTELYRFSLYYMKNPHDAQDAVQNACLMAFRKINTLKNEDSFKAWFFRILYNECLKIHTDKASETEYPTEDITLFTENTSDVCREYDILALLDELEPKERAIVTLSVFHNYTSSEIAEILGMNPSTVRSSLSRILKKLRSRIEGV